MSKLYFTHGPMGSQKSTELLAVAYNFEEHGGKVLVVKPAKDSKGDRQVVSRIGLAREVDFLITPELDVQAEVLERSKKLKQLSAVLIDEAQFLEPKQVDQLLALVVANGIPVMAYGLRTDFMTHVFPGSKRLLELAHTIRESITMCGHGDGCKRRAQFNARQKGGKFVAEGEQVAIDGAGDVTYTSLCAVHYLQDVGPITSES